jgi:hypothetical protein
VADESSFTGILWIGSSDDVSHAPSVGRISLRHAQFERDVHITGIEISKLILEGINVRRDVKINSIRVLGPVSMDRSSIDGETEIDDSNFGYRRPIDRENYWRALSFERSRFEGTVRITNSNVSGHMSAYLARFNDGVYLGAGSEYAGKVDLSSSETARVLDLAGGRYALLDLKNAKVGGQLALYSPDGGSVLWDGFRSSEDRQFAEVTRGEHHQLSLEGASFGRIEDIMPDSESLACGRELARLHATTFEDPWPSAVRIADVAFEELLGWRPVVDTACRRWDLHPLTQRSMQWVKAWLARAEGDDWAPYETLAAYFEKHNADDRAAEVREMRWRSEQSHYCSSSDDWLLCVATVVYGTVFHYGIGDWRSWAGVATLVFALSLIGKLVLQKDAGFPCFDPRPGFLFSFDRLLPIISLDDHHKDIVLRTPWVRWYFAVHTLLGWAIAVFLGAWAARLVE